MELQRVGMSEVGDYSKKFELDLKKAKTLGFDKVSHEELMAIAVELVEQTEWLQKTIDLNNVLLDKYGLSPETLNLESPRGLLKYMLLKGVSKNASNGGKGTAKRYSPLIKHAIKLVNDKNPPFKSRRNAANSIKVDVIRYGENLNPKVVLSESQASNTIEGWLKDAEANNLLERALTQKK